MSSRRRETPQNDDDETKEWFYGALSKKLNPDSAEGEQFFYNLLNSPLRTILCVTPVKKIMYNGGNAARHMAGTISEEEYQQLKDKILKE